MSGGEVKAWEKLLVRNVPDALRLNTKFLGRLSDNPNLVNYVDNLSDAGKTNLANNVDDWIKRYDVRQPLKNGNVSEAVTILEGTLGSPQVYNGANYVDALTSSQATKFNNIINSTTDASQIANNLGIDIDVVQSMKQHLFVSEHLIEVVSGTFVNGRFATFEHIADWWNQVKVGNLDNASELKKLISHEYIESKLMKEGMIYRFLDSPTASKYGAHELSSHEDLFNFSHWGSMGREIPSVSLNPNLSNIDDVVNQIKTIEGL